MQLKSAQEKNHDRSEGSNSDTEKSLEREEQTNKTQAATRRELTANASKKKDSSIKIDEKDAML